MFKYYANARYDEFCACFVTVRCTSKLKGSGEALQFLARKYLHTAVRVHNLKKPNK